MKTKKILFIIPPYFNIQDYIKNDKKSILPQLAIPYGVLSIDSYLRSHSIYTVKSEVLDLNLQVYKIVNSGKEGIYDNIQDILREIILRRLEKKFDVAAISALFNPCYYYLEIVSSAVKASSNPAACVIGGGIASNLYEKILQDFQDIDGICYAEGEIPMKDLVDSDNYMELMDNHQSWVTRKSLGSGKTPLPTYIENLDDIPVFSYDNINLDDYKGRAADVYNVKKGVKRELSIHTSRGCPFRCIYCASSTVHGYKLRFMSVERVIAEIDLMIERYNMDVLLIEDDHFLGNKKRAAKILSLLSRKNIKIEFLSGIAVHPIDEEIASLMAQAGVSSVSLAVESGSDYVLKLMNKPLRKHQIKKRVEILRSHGILVHAYIILGVPGEMDCHRMETIEMLKDVGFDWVYFFNAVPVVGSRLYNICVANDYLAEKDFRNHIQSKSTINAPGVDPEKIQKTLYLYNLETNFVDNYNLRSGNYETAFLYFLKIVQKYPQNAFAHYALAECYRLSGEDLDLAEVHYSNFRDIIRNDPEWKSYADYFGLLGYV